MRRVYHHRPAKRYILLWHMWLQVPINHNMHVEVRNLSEVRSLLLVWVLQSELKCPGLCDKDFYPLSHLKNSEEHFFVLLQADQ